MIDPLKYLFQGDSNGNPVNHIDVDSHRRGDNAHLRDEHDDNTEPDGVVSQLNYDGIEDGNGQHDQG